MHRHEREQLHRLRIQQEAEDRVRREAEELLQRIYEESQLPKHGLYHPPVMVRRIN